MKTSYNLVSALFLLGGLLGASLNAGEWSLHYYSPTDNPFVSATVQVPSAATVSITSNISINWQTEGYPWAYLQIAVEGPNYAKVLIRNLPFGSPTDYVYGTPGPGEYYVEVNGSTNPGSVIDAYVQIDW